MPHRAIIDPLRMRFAEIAAGEQQNHNRELCYTKREKNLSLTSFFEWNFNLDYSQGFLTMFRGFYSKVLDPVGTRAN